MINPPENVRLVTTEGEHIPLDMIYQGELDGQHWWINTHACYRTDIDRIRIDRLWPDTRIALRLGQQTWNAIEQRGDTG